MHLSCRLKRNFIASIFSVLSRAATGTLRKTPAADHPILISSDRSQVGILFARSNIALCIQGYVQPWTYWGSFKKGFRGFATQAYSCENEFICWDIQWFIILVNYLNYQKLMKYLLCQMWGGIYLCLSQWIWLIYLKTWISRVFSEFLET